MFEIKKVFFNNTVHWPGLGPITEISCEVFTDAVWVENMPGFAFEHTSGEITWVPASNVRWVRAIIIADPNKPQTPEPEPTEEAIAKRRGRPKKSDVH